MWLSPTELLITWTHYTHLDELYIINWGSWFVASGIIVELEGTRTSLLGTWRGLPMTGQATRWIATPSVFFLKNAAVGYNLRVSSAPVWETIGRQISTQEWAYAELKLDQDTSQADPHAPTQREECLPSLRLRLPEPRKKWRWQRQPSRLNIATPQVEMVAWTTLGWPRFLGAAGAQVPSDYCH